MSYRWTEDELARLVLRLEGVVDAMQQRHDDRRLLTAEQVAERWQVPKSQVNGLARSGKLPVVRLGRYIRFAPAAIEAWERDGGEEA